MNPEITHWLLMSLFWLGVVVAILGLMMALIPGVILRSSLTLNKWISTESFFHSMDRPRKSERFIYRHHRVFGICIILGAAYCLWTAIQQSENFDMVTLFPVIGNPDLSSWIYSSIFYAMLLAIGVALVLGFIVFLRPSLIKSIESRANYWVGNEKILRTLDSRHSIPEELFPGNLRLFGIAVLLGGVFIMLNVLMVLQT